MLAEMHCHYPMHVIARAPKRPLPGSPRLTVEAMAEVARRPRWLEGNAMRMARRVLAGQPRRDP